MSSKILKNAVKAALVGSVVVATSTAMAADRKLLDMLKANGAITAVQHEELMQDSSEDVAETLKKMAWASKIQVKGDIRLRQEFVNVRGVGSNSGDDEDRQRVRARVGIYADVNENLKAGVRLATGGDSATSANETLGDGFTKDDAYFDLVYLDWSPVEGLDLIGGKFKQPWEQVSGGLVWDGDINPEGGAVRYTANLGGANLIASAGHLVLDDVDGYSFDEDMTVQYAQVATKFKSDGLNGKFGVSVYDYDENDISMALISGGGNDSTEFSIQELFGEVEVKAVLPLTFYGHWAKNADANGVNSGEDTAWLLGVATKTGPWKFSYDYRETELNAVNGAFNDSDFAGGMTDSEGHKFKIAYKIDKNFSIETTYLDAETGSLASDPNWDIETWQIDLKAKF